MGTRPSLGLGLGLGFDVVGESPRSLLGEGGFVSSPRSG